MAEASDNLSGYVTVRVCAASIGVPAAFLDREIEARRIPFIDTGSRILVDAAAVKLELDSRAERAVMTPDGVEYRSTLTRPR